nr:hypothetical protein [Tanacetum cinerariifolium]
TYEGRDIRQKKVGKINMKEEGRTFSRLTSGTKRCFATSSSYRRVNHESKRLDRVVVTEFVDGEQFVTEEIIEEGNHWPNIECLICTDHKSQCTCFVEVSHIKSSSVSEVSSGSRRWLPYRLGRVRVVTDVVYRKEGQDQ